MLNGLFSRLITWVKQKRQRELDAAAAPSDYKYIIVGAGTAGCITAYTLASQMQTNNISGRVLLVDAGDSFSAPDGPNPRLSKWFTNWAKFSVAHETSAENNTFLPAPATTHMGVGGAGSHDTRITYVPTKRWQQQVEKTMKWRPNEMAAYLQLALDMMPIRSARTCERFYDAALDTWSRTKTLVVPQNRERHFETQIVANSAAYVSLAMFGDETRWTSAWLIDDLVRPSNLDVVTSAPVDKVLFERSAYGGLHWFLPELSKPSRPQASGILLASGDKIQLDHTTHASEVILTAGALGTPAILQRSGIGPRNHLESLGIKVLVANDEVGHGTDHLEVPVQYEWLPQWNEHNGAPPRGGPMAWPLVLFLNDGDILAHFGLAAPPYGDGSHIVVTPNRTEPCAAAGFRATIPSPKPKDPIRLVHIDHQGDFDTLANGVRKTVEVMDVLQQHHLVGARVQPTDEDLATHASLDLWMRSNPGTAFHWQGTCRAGKANNDDADAGHSLLKTRSVADHHFRVRGVRNLRVGSAACIPQPTEANPHLTISAFAIALAYDMLQLKPPNMNIEMPHPRVDQPLIPDTSHVSRNYWNQKRYQNKV